MANVFVTNSEGPGKVVGDGDEFNNLGYTNPDLYRKIDPTARLEPEVAPRDYKLGIYNKDSILTTYISTHDELSTTDEIP